MSELVIKLTGEEYALIREALDTARGSHALHGQHLTARNLELLREHISRFAHSGGAVLTETD